MDTLAGLPSAAGRAAEVSGCMVDESIKAIREYVWAKYIDFSHHGDDMDERAALATLEEYHRSHPIAADGETYYLGILDFELAFSTPEPDLRLLARAKRVLERYQDRTGERDWEAVADRIEEADGALSDLPAAELEALLAEIDADLDEGAAAASAAEPPSSAPGVVDGMVFVPGGTFVSGTAGQSKDVKSFWIDQYPVSNAEYRQFVEATGYRSPKFWSEGRLRDPDAPVVGVSWYDAFKYAAFVGKSLPSKDQWEKAVRGTKGGRFSWGDELDETRANYGKEEGSDAVAKNGEFPSNVSEFGVCEAIGNVWEWTDSPDPQDPEQRIICGGSWCDPEDFIRADQHLAAYPKDKYDNIGFRCVRVAKE